MKRILLNLLFFFLPLTLFSQTFNDGKILKRGKFSAGVNPVIEDKLPGVYVRGGYGLKRNVDLNVKYGVFEGADYFGADIGWYLKGKRHSDFSMYAGAHGLKNYGLDAGLSAGFTLSPHVSIFTGLDADLNFNVNLDHFIWLPVGIKFYLSPRTRFILEGDLPLVEFAPGILGGGLSILVF